MLVPWWTHKGISRLWPPREPHFSCSVPTHQWKFRQSNRNLRTRCLWQREASDELSFTLISPLQTLRVDLRCNIDNLPVFEPISETQTQSEQHSKSVHVPEVCDNIMCTVVPNNNNLWTKATGMGVNGCGVLNPFTFVLFGEHGACWLRTPTLVGLTVGGPIKWDWTVSNRVVWSVWSQDRCCTAT